MSTVARHIGLAGPPSAVTLRDGSGVHLRPVAAHDEGAMRAFLEGVSPESLRRRFCGATDPARVAMSLVGGCGVGDVGLVAQAASSTEIVAHGASFRIDASRAEVAFLVTDAWQGRGLGGLLLSCLVEDAEQRGVSTLVAEVLPGNRAMIAVFERCGYPVAVRWDAHGVEVEIDLAARIPVLARVA
ncbi:MAG: GNAT family N-acetyltransferase [Solirubrobacteraceae bacterium]